jgi:hypothetical protein
MVTDTRNLAAEGVNVATAIGPAGGSQEEKITTRKCQCEGILAKPTGRLLEAAGVSRCHLRMVRDEEPIRCGDEIWKGADVE